MIKRLIAVCCAVLPALAGLADISEIDAEINKVGAEMFNVGAEARDLREEIDAAFSSGSCDTPEMKKLRTSVQTCRAAVIRDSAEAVRLFKEIPEVAERYAAYAECKDKEKAEAMLVALEADRKSGRYDTEAIKELNGRIAKTEALAAKLKADLRKMLEEQPRFSEIAKKLRAFNEKLDKLAERRAELLEKRAAASR